MEEILELHFTWHGFRYIKVEGVKSLPIFKKQKMVNLFQDKTSRFKINYIRLTNYN